MNSRLKLVMKSGKAILGYKATTKALRKGKAKMILQSIAIPVIIFLVVNFKTAETPWAMWTCHVLVYLMLIVTVWSGIPYITGMRAVAAETPGGEPDGEDAES